MVSFKVNQASYLTLLLTICSAYTCFAESKSTAVRDSSKVFSLNTLHNSTVISNIVAHYTRLKSLNINDDRFLLIILIPRNTDSTLLEPVNIDDIQGELHFNVSQVSRKDTYLCQTFSAFLEFYYYTSIGGQDVLVQCVDYELRQLKPNYFASIYTKCDDSLVLEALDIDTQNEVYMIDKNGVIWRGIN